MNVFEPVRSYGSEIFDDYYEDDEDSETDDDSDSETDEGNETDDDLPALWNTITEQYVPSTRPQTEIVSLSGPNNEPMADVCCICLEHHRRTDAVTLKNSYGNVCHEIGMTCFLQWSDRCRRRHTAVTCPLCKSNVSTVVYQLGN